MINPVWAAMATFAALAGYVAMVVGGFGERPPNNLVEVFSPDGGCQHLLQPLPAPQLTSPVIGLLDGRVVVCGDYYDHNVRLVSKLSPIQRFGIKGNNLPKSDLLGFCYCSS